VLSRGHPSELVGVAETGVSAGCWLVVAKAFEVLAVVDGLDDVAVVDEAIDQRSGHLGIRRWAIPEGEVSGDGDRGTIVKPADQVEEELRAGLSKGQIAELVETIKSTTL
jgi:hypothetical protein